jgi:general secretion pathway protein J
MIRRSAGFTLLEVIIALVVFGLLMAGLSQTLRFGLAAWRTEGRLSDSRGELETVDRTLRLIVQNLMPGDDTGRPAIVGTTDTLSGISRMPTPESGLADAPVEVGLALSGNRLILRWRPYVRAERLAPPPPPREATLIGGVARIAIAYWQPRGSWVTAWKQPNLPSLIRLRVEFRGENPPRWPDFVLAPLLSQP